MNLLNDLKNCTDLNQNYLCSKCVPDNIDKCHEGYGPFAALFHYCSINDVMGILALFFNILFYISPIFEFQKIRKFPLQIHNFPKYFLLANLINASVQVGIVIHAYQYLPYDFIANCIGIFINLIYSISYLHTLFKGNLKKVILYVFGTMCYLAIVISFFYYLPYFIYFNCKENTKKPDIINDIRINIPVMVINTIMLIMPLQNLVNYFFINFNCYLG